jgi:hypothetical protein
MVLGSRRQSVLDHESPRDRDTVPAAIAPRGDVGRVRSAHLDDTPELVRLLTRAGAPDPLPRREADVQAWLDRGHLLVLDDGGTLRAVAFVERRIGSGRVELLAVEPELVGRGIEERMIGVADALRAAFGERDAPSGPACRTVTRGRGRR